MSPRQPVRTGPPNPLAWLLGYLVDDLAARTAWKPVIIGLMLGGFAAFFVIRPWEGGPAPLHRADGFVTDAAGVLGGEAKRFLEDRSAELERRTGIELAVVTVPSLGDESVEKYAHRLFNEWGVGKKGRDNGVLLLVAPRERKVRIEVGYGLESVLPDGLCGEIIREAGLPEFRESRYAAGVGAMTMRIVAAATGKPAPVGGKPAGKKSSGMGWMENLLLTSFMASIAGLMTWMAGGGLANRLILPLFLYGGLSIFFVLPALDGLAATPLGAAKLLIVLAALVGGFILGIRTGRADPKFLREDGDGSGWAAGWGACGFGGGGRGGFGGGSSGGGGASGGW